MSVENGQAREQGARIRASRLAAGLSIPQLADAVGATAGAVSHWETGRHSPRRHRQIAIAQAVGVPWIDLFRDELSEGSER